MGRRHGREGRQRIALLVGTRGPAVARSRPAVAMGSLAAGTLHSSLRAAA